jgi:hypothetical protein
MKHYALIALFHACGAFASSAGELAYAADQNDTTYFTGYVPKGFPAERENPSEIRLPVSLKLCKSLANEDFSLYVFEIDALRKLDRFGVAGLDDYDRKWVSAHDNRKAACLALIKRNGGASYLDRAKAWLREKLSE